MVANRNPSVPDTMLYLGPDPARSSSGRAAAEPGARNHPIGGEFNMVFSATVRWTTDSGTYLYLAGQLRGRDALLLYGMMLDVVFGDLPDGLVVDLQDLAFLDGDGHRVLVAGYAAAIEHGVRVRMINANGQVRVRLQDAWTLDVLADSDDLGALLAAVALRSL